MRRTRTPQPDVRVTSNPGPYPYARTAATGNTRTPQPHTPCLFRPPITTSPQQQLFQKALEDICRKLEMPLEEFISKTHCSALLFLTIAPNQFYITNNAALLYMGINLKTIISSMHSHYNQITANHLSFIIDRAQASEHALADPQSPAENPITLPSATRSNR